MPNDEIADMLDEVDEEIAEKLLANLEDDADEVRELMGYEEETVGSIMNPDFISFHVNISVGEVIEIIRDLKPDPETSNYIYITDEDDKLEGVISLMDLILAKSETNIKDIMNTNIVYVSVNDSIEHTIELAVKYDLIAVPVLDEEDKLCGIAIIHDIIDEYVYHHRRRKNR